MNNDKPFKLLIKNPEKVFNEAVSILRKIALNIINNPNISKYRFIPKHNKTISNKILPIQGGIQCLKLMGFTETNEGFSMESVYPTAKIQEFIQKLDFITLPTDVITEEKDALLDEKHFKQITLPPYNSIFTNPFLKQIELNFHNALSYEDKEVQSFAKSLIPLDDLEQTAQNTLRNIQVKIKKEKLENPEYSIQDTQILALLSWFKNDFFKWVDSPPCFKCHTQTKMSHMSSDPENLIYTNRVEVHKCPKCQSLTNFPRYNDLNILLHTRKGRCGEWANTFTLFCRAMGWDARYVIDETDHVWTEVYSVARKRWIHCDPCENSCDSPLIYEHGWKKKLSYVIAYSGDEVQDVTWRYSSKHKEILARRKKCSESELVNALIKLRNNRQKNYTQARRNYLTKRVLSELVELLNEKQPSDTDGIGRLSGSLEWRSTRGETQTRATEMFVWLILDKHTINNRLVIKYSTVQDCYIYDLVDKKAIIKNWDSAVFSYSNLFRKEEHDWKTCYLARKEGSDNGYISWKYILHETTKVIESISLKFDYQTFENGLVNIQIISDLRVVDVPKGGDIFKTGLLSGCKSFQIVANLSGGKSDVAWQHAQLFRQNLDSEEYPFKLEILFKDSI